MLLDKSIEGFVRLGNEEALIRPLLKQFTSCIAEAAEFARLNRVLLLTASNGTPIAMSLAGLPFEEAIISRASLFRYAPSVVLMTCSAEDLIVLKAIAGRPQDWVDIEGVLKRQKKLDISQIETHLASVAELMPERDILEEFTSRYFNRRKSRVSCGIRRLNRIMAGRGFHADRISR